MRTRPAHCLTLQAACQGAHSPSLWYYIETLGTELLKQTGTTQPALDICGLCFKQVLLPCTHALSPGLTACAIQFENCPQCAIYTLPMFGQCQPQGPRPNSLCHTAPTPQQPNPNIQGFLHAACSNGPAAVQKVLALVQLLLLRRRRRRWWLAGGGWPLGLPGGEPPYLIEGGMPP
jgi:hypothetical protein